MRLRGALFALASFISACLLFVVQPLLAKWLLPSYGGSPSIWAACMLFFQTLLLGGYAYAHATTRWLSARAQRVTHAVLLALAAGYALHVRELGGPDVLPLTAALAIVVQLALRVGPAYFALAATAPLVQRWAAASDAHDESESSNSEPYVLYALSNAGSLLALLGYPFVLEPALGVPAQFRAWTLGFVGFAALMWLVIALASDALSLPPSAAAVASWSTRLRWFGYALVPSVMLLAVTQHITIDIAAMPLLWVVPLALYLVTFIWAFSRAPALPRGLLLVLWIAACIGIAWNAFAQGSASLSRQLGFSLLGMFTCALGCHRELAAERPPVTQLTGYYLWIAAGGATGAVLVSLIAPLVWNDYYELELAAIATFVMLCFAVRRFSAGERRLLQLGIGICVPLLIATAVTRAQGETRQGKIVERMRSFLGPLRVIQFDVGRVLTHGRIRHGMQLSAAALRDQPTMYFGPGTALSAALSRQLAGSPKHIGVLGLGVGTLAAYAKRGDTLRFYELDPNVVTLAQRDFTFLRDCPAHVEVEVGDGRLLLARERDQRFDALVLDAFSSDSVPVHLLTREAFALYVQRLRPGGVLLANVSNRHLEVDRVVRASAASQGLAVRVVQTDADAAHFVSKVRWAVMGKDATQLDALVAGFQPLADNQPHVLWTDAHASLWSIVR